MPFKADSPLFQTIPFDERGIGQERTEVANDGSMYISQFRNQFSLLPHWGTSMLRDDPNISGTGAQIAEEDGHLLLDAGTDNNGFAHLSTLERGLYLPGAVMQTGVGVRIPTLPTGTEYYEWGPFTVDDEGVGFGYDSTGLYIFRRVNGTELERIYQGNWNVFQLDGADPDLGAAEVDLTQGAAFHIDVAWYGFGSINFKIETTEPVVPGDERRFYTVHRINVDQFSMFDPNLPIRITADNGASPGTQAQIQLGGRQIAIGRGLATPRLRLVEEVVTRYETVNNGNQFQCVGAWRSKPTFSTAGRVNTVRVTFDFIKMVADNPIEWRVVYEPELDPPAWKEADGYAATETATEFALGPIDFNPADSIPVLKDVNISANKTTATAAAVERVEVVLAAGKQCALLVRNLTNAQAVLDYVVAVTESW